MPDPPRLARLILRLCFPRRGREFVLGDLEEEYRHRLHRDGHQAARRWYWRQTVGSAAAGIASLVLPPRRRSPGARTGERLPAALAYDLRAAVRSLARRPGFTLLTVSTLAVGIGANTAIFSFVEATLLRPPPYHKSDRLITADGKSLFGERLSSSGVLRQVVAAWTDARTLSAVGAYHPVRRTLLLESGAVALEGAAISTNLLPLLGSSPLLGRGFVSSADAADQILLSRAIVRRHFSSDAAIVGERIRFNNNEVRTVTGVMPEEFRFPHADAGFWIPLSPLSPKPDADRFAARSHVSVIARLAPRAGLAAARTELESIWQQWADQDSLRFEQTYLAVARYRKPLAPEGRAALLLLATTTGVLLAIACANLANLFLTRVDARSREIALRRALGAGRLRLLGQVACEAAVVSLAGAGLGSLLALGTTALLVAQVENVIPGVGDVAIDTRMLGFAVALSLLCSLCFGLAPGLATAGASRARLVGTTVGGERRGRPLRSALVVAQLALALVLLVIAALLSHSLVRRLLLDEGFDPSRVLGVTVTLPTERYPAPRVEPFVRNLIERLDADPGVETVAAGTAVPYLKPDLPALPIESDHPSAVSPQPGSMPTPEQMAAPASVYGPFFSTLGVAIRQGRGLTADDYHPGARTAIINRVMADRFWPGEDPVGRRFGVGSLEFAPQTVVGVVDLHHRGEAVFYQGGRLARSPDGVSIALVLRTAGEPEELIGTVRQEVAALDREIPIQTLAPVGRLISSSQAPHRFRTFLLAALATIAVALALIGVYGVVALNVARRAHEIGVRMALGASRRRVLGEVLMHSGGLTVAGIAIGLGAALWASRLLESLLFDLAPSDPLTYAAVAAMLTVASLLSSLLPARRASRVEPVVVLRHE